jgi:hypothetical protein
MNITIEGLNKNVARQMIKDCTNRIFKDRTQVHSGVIDVTINPSVTMKVYDDVIFFDLGGNLTSLHMSEFFNITIQ